MKFTQICYHFDPNLPSLQNYLKKKKNADGAKMFHRFFHYRNTIFCFLYIFPM